jgi:hypothetical protein
MFDIDEFYQIRNVSVELYENGERIGDSFDDVFDRFYGDIQERIDAGEYETGRTTTNRTMGQTDTGEDTTTQAQQDRRAWLHAMEDVAATLEVDVTIAGDKTKTYEYDLVPRTDFGFDAVQAAPSVVKVMDGDAMRLAVREWTHYTVPENDEETDNHVDILTKLARYGKHFNRNSHDDTFYETIGTDGYDPDTFDSGITMLPELYLAAALHKEGGVYETDDVQPVTPYNVRVAELYDDAAYVIRPWLHDVFSGGVSHPAEAEHLGEFYGTCAGLGLVGCFDRQAEFYTDNHDGDDVTVNIDPEFWAYTDRPRWFIGADLDDFQTVVQETGSTTASFLAQMKDVINATEARLDDDLDVDILDELPRQVDRDMFPDEKVIDR